MESPRHGMRLWNVVPLETRFDAAQIGRGWGGPSQGLCKISIPHIGMWSTLNVLSSAIPQDSRAKLENKLTSNVYNMPKRCIFPWALQNWGSISRTKRMWERMKPWISRHLVVVRRPSSPGWRSCHPVILRNAIDAYWPRKQWTLWRLQVHMEVWEIASMMHKP